MTPGRFTIAVPQDDLDDLKARLSATRWPDATPGGGWAQGTEAAYLRDLVERWRAGYDWRQHERRARGAPALGCGAAVREIP
jgi:microsomal epoxide hydrolase